MFEKGETLKSSYWVRFSYFCVNLVEHYLDHKIQNAEKNNQRRIRQLKFFGKYGTRIVEWIQAFFWAAIWVFLINQYLLQAYMIPSESMVPTLIVSDRVFVNKLFAGPELLPGTMKLPALKSSKRGDVVIFSNPELRQVGGTAFQIMHRLVYMLTLSMIDIGNRESSAQLLVKRSISAGGDQVIFRNSQLFLRPEGLIKFYNEVELQKITGLSYPVEKNLVLKQQDHDIFAAYRAYQVALKKSSYPKSAPLPSKYHDLEKKIVAMNKSHFLGNFYEINRSSNLDAYILTLYKLMPYDRDVKKQYLQSFLGHYISHGEFLPLGDNRNNSRDGRYFGTVKNFRILGGSIWRFYPFNRSGKVI